jgi:acetyl esterase/lipase
MQVAKAQRRRPDFPDVDVQRDLVYKEINGQSLRLDIYSPKSITHPLPVVLWIHGHRWSRGSKAQRPPVNLMAEGYIIVSIDSVEQNKAKAIAASPISYISKDDPAFLVIPGENDLSIPVSQSEVFVEKLKTAGVDATLEVAEGRGHGVGGPRYASEITSLFDKHLKKGSAN